MGDGKLRRVLDFFLPNEISLKEALSSVILSILLNQRNYQKIEDETFPIVMKLDQKFQQYISLLGFSCFVFSSQFLFQSALHRQ